MRKTRLGNVFFCMLFFAIFAAVILGLPIGIVTGSWNGGMIFFGAIGALGGLGYYFDEDSKEHMPWDIPYNM